MDKASEAILSLHPVSFRFKKELDSKERRNSAWWRKSSEGRSQSGGDGR
jgi:hypothetical protein